MGWLDFFASLVGSLVKLGWPAAVFGMVWIFRRELVPLLPLLKVKHKDTEVSFRLGEAQKEAAQIPPPPPENLLPPPPPEDQAKGMLLAELNPRAAVLDARAELEQAVRDTAVRFGLVEQAANRPAAHFIRQLRPLLPSNLGALLEDLRAVGNAAAHNSDARQITTWDAKNFRELTTKAITSLNAARPPRRDIA